MKADATMQSPVKVEGFEKVLGDFQNWLSGHGELSWDHQSYFAGPIGGRAKALYYRNRTVGTLAVAPMIFSEALLPSARRLFAHPVRFPIADAHYAMGFAFLARAQRSSRLHAQAVRFLEALERSRCPNYKEYCWGYPFDWVTRTGTVAQDTPLITSTPYMYEAFRDVYLYDKNPRWREVMASIVRHVLTDIKDFPGSSEKSSTCSYTPFDQGGVVNASAYRAGMLTQASVEFNEPHYWDVASRNVNFVLDAQNPDGSWPYAKDGVRDFVDHFHTCFVLKALAKIHRFRPQQDDVWQAIERGVRFYQQNLLDEEGLPKPFAAAPRLTVYKRELYDYAECINLCLLVRGRIPGMNRVLATVVDDLRARWIKKDGAFRSRELLFGWDNVPMHRWAQSQMFRSLSLLVLDARGEAS